MSLADEHKKHWDAYIAEPQTNPLVYGHPEQWGTVVLENKLCFFLVDDKAEILPGSGMIMPKALRPTVFDLTAEEFAATFALLQEVKAYLEQHYQPDGYSVGWNVYPVGGQHVPQAHLHVIPRFADEPYEGRGVRYWLKQRENQRPTR
jgi:diadenosine tetraphosphate (Ap4A) HIT family hydrolase